MSRSPTEFSPSPDAFVGHFETFPGDTFSDCDALAKAYGALDSDALDAVFVRAASVRDLKRVALAGPELLRRGRLSRPSIFLLGRALAAHGRYAEALEAFLHPAVRSHDNVKYIRARVATFAKLGRTLDALKVLEGAMAVHPEYNLADLRGPLDLIQTFLDHPPQTGDEVVALADAYLRFGLNDRTAELLERSCPAESRWPSLAALLDWAKLALRVLPPDRVKAELAAAPAHEHADARWRAIWSAAAALSGEAPTPGIASAPDPEDKSLRLWRGLAHERSGATELAIRELCVLAEEDRTNLNIRRALARNVGRMVLDQVQPKFAPGRTGRIINLVPFFNELRMLRIHLEEMSPWVDKFVIVEGTQTFTGKDKELYFEANRHLFAEFASKIVHVPIRQFPESLTSAWARDFYQRDMSIAGASGLCGQEDYILETDVDELVDYGALQGLEADFAALDLRLSRFFLNYRPAPGHPDRTQPKASIFKAKHRMRYGVSLGRFFLAQQQEAYLVQDAGWHFTSMFDEHGISLKVNSYAHQEHQKAKFRTPSHFQALRQRLQSGALDPDWERVELDESFPASLLRNREMFADVIL